MKKITSKSCSCKLFWISHMYFLWCVVLLHPCDYAYGYDSSGIIQQFPHSVGYWPPEYNPHSINSVNYYNYTPTMSTNVEDLQMSTVAQERTIQVSILLPHSFTKHDRKDIIDDCENKECKTDESTNCKLNNNCSVTCPSLNRNVGLEHIAFAQKRSGVGLLVGFQTIREKNLIRDDIFFNITLRDSKCHGTYGQKTFLDAYSEKVHVLFGPSCDLSLGKYRSIKMVNVIFVYHCGLCIYNCSNGVSFYLE